jgi:hypothetical protein
MVCNPDTIATKGDLDRLIAELEAFERKHGPSGIIRKLGCQGASFEIATAESAHGSLGKQVGEETITNYWSTNYLRMAREQYD